MKESWRKKYTDFCKRLGVIEVKMANICKRFRRLTAFQRNIWWRQGEKGCR